MYQDLSTRHDWPVKQAIVDLPIKMKGNSNRSSGNSLSPSGAQNKDVNAASQTLLTDVTPATKATLPVDLSRSKRSLLTLPNVGLRQRDLRCFRPFRGAQRARCEQV